MSVYHSIYKHLGCGICIAVGTAILAGTISISRGQNLPIQSPDRNLILVGTTARDIGNRDWAYLSWLYPSIQE